MYEWLQDYQEIEQEVMYLEFELSRNRRELGRWISGDLVDVKLSEKSKATYLEETIFNIEYELAHKMNDLYDSRRLISKFKGLDHQIIYRKYVEGKKLIDMAGDLGKCPNYIYNKHTEIMKRIDFAYNFN
nr:hypothetical protein [Saliterribacillus persicus]